MRLSGIAVVVGLVVALGAVGSCGDAPPPPAPPDAGPPLPPPEAPADLALHGSLAPADRSLPRLRPLLGAPEDTRAPSFGALVVGAAGLPITAAEIVSTDAPVRFLLLSPEPGSGPVRLVFALHLRAADRLEPIAAGGAGARFRADRATPGLLRLRPVGGPEDVHLAVVGDHLVLAWSEDALVRSARFAGLVAPPAPEGDALAVARVGPGVAGAAEALATRLGRLAPRLPLPLSGARSGAAAWAHLVGGRIELRERASSLALSVEGPASAAVALAGPSRPAGPPEPWLAMPRDATFALLRHEAEADRIAAAAALDPAVLAPLGLGAERAEAARAALERLARARGAALALGVGATPEGPAAWVRAEIVDGEAADAALDELVRSIGKRPGRPASARRTVVERVGDAHRVRLTPGGDGARAVDLLLRREEGALLGAVGLDAAAAMRALRAADPPATLGSEPLARSIADAAARPLALLFADLAALGAAAPRPQPAPVAAGIWVDGERLRALALVSPPAARALHAILLSPEP